MGVLITGCSILFIALVLCFLHISLRTNYTQRTAKLEAQLVMESPEAPPIETIEVIRPWYSYWGEDWTYVVYFWINLDKDIIINTRSRTASILKCRIETRSKSGR